MQRQVARHGEVHVGDAGAREIGALRGIPDVHFLAERVAQGSVSYQGEEGCGQRVGEQRNSGAALDVGAAYPVDVQP